jgi:uncharacterized protein
MKELSIYTLLFQNEGNYYLLNTETLVKAQISESLFQNLSNKDFSDINVDTLDILLKKHIIVEEKDKYNFFNKMEIETNTVNYDMSTITLYIMPTIGCNFCCPYCFEGPKPEKSMNSKTIDYIVHFLNNTSAKYLSLHWYGGEPLIRFDLMKQIYEKITHETSLKISNHNIITNGYLINDEVINFFKRTQMSNVQITLDGKKDIHDQKRFLKITREGTFDRLISNIKKLGDELPKCNINVRVNIDKQNYKDFVYIYHFVHKECDINNNITVYPAIIKAYDKSGKRIASNCFSHEELFSLYKYYEEKGCNVNFFPLPHKHTCSICNLCTFTIGPEGEYYKCPEDANDPKRIIGNINSESIVNQSLLMMYVNESSQFKRKKCKNCLCFPICFGGCGKEYLKDVYHNAKINYCHPLKNKKFLKQAFLEDIKNKNRKVKNNYIIDIC